MDERNNKPQTLTEALDALHKAGGELWAALIEALNTPLNAYQWLLFSFIAARVITIIIFSG